MPAPRGDRGRSSGGRQRHYGSVDLAGTGERVHVDDVIEVVTQDSTGTGASQPRLAQVGSGQARPNGRTPFTFFHLGSIVPIFTVHVTLSIFKHVE